MKTQPSSRRETVSPRPQKRLIAAAVLVAAIALGIFIRLALHRAVPCGSGMSPAIPSACSGPVSSPSTLPES